MTSARLFDLLYISGKSPRANSTEIMLGCGLVAQLRIGYWGKKQECQYVCCWAGLIVLTDPTWTPTLGQLLLGRRRLNSSRVVEPPTSSFVASTMLFLLQTNHTGDLRFLANTYHKLLTCLSGPVPAELMGRNGRNEKGCSRGASFLRHGCSSHPFPLGGREVSRTSLKPG